MCHVVWDWNGCLFDDNHVVVEAVNAVLHAWQRPGITAADYRRHYTRPVRTFYQRLLGRPIDDSEWSRLDELYHDAYRAGLDRAGLAADADRALAHAAGSGTSQSLLSMWRHDELVELVRRFGLDGRFVRVDGLRGPPGGRKAAALRRHLDALPRDVDPADVVVIGDALDDADAARQVGTGCVLYQGGTHRRSELASAGVPVAGTLVDALRLAGITT